MACGSDTTLLKRLQLCLLGPHIHYTKPQALAAGTELWTPSLPSPVSLRRKSPLPFHYDHPQVLPPVACFREGKKCESGRVASRWKISQRRVKGSLQPPRVQTHARRSPTLTWTRPPSSRPRACACAWRHRASGPCAYAASKVSTGTPALFSRCFGRRGLGAPGGWFLVHLCSDGL